MKLLSASYTPMMTVHHMRLALLLFMIGVITQSIAFKPTKSLETTLQAITAILILSALISFLSALESKYQFDGIVFMGTTIIFFMSIYGLCFFNALLPSITEKSLLLFNSIFLYYLYSNGSRLDIYLLPSLLVLVNAFIPYKPPNSIKFLFYIWYLWMSVVLLSILSANKPGALTYMQMLDKPFMRLEWMMTFFSLGMIYLYFFVNVIHIVIPVILLYAKFDNFKYNGKSNKKNMTSKLMNLYFSSIYEKYLDENLHPIDNLILLFIVIFILLANHYVLHINEALVINVIFLVCIYQNRLMDRISPTPLSRTPE